MVSHSQRRFEETRQALLSRLSKDPFDRGLLEEYGQHLDRHKNLAVNFGMLHQAAQQAKPAKGRCPCCNEHPSSATSPYCELCRETTHFHCAFCRTLVRFVNPFLDLDKSLLLCQRCEKMSQGEAEDPLINDCRELLQSYLWVRAYNVNKSKDHDRCVQIYARWVSAPLDSFWLVQLLTDARCDFYRRHSLVTSLAPHVRSTFEYFLLADGPASE